MKVCNECKVEKEINLFGLEKKGKDGHRGSCKECVKKKRKHRDRTKIGLLSRIFLDQKSHSKARGDIPPTYSKTEFIGRFLNDEKYLTLYDRWVEAYFYKPKIPSFDRLNDYKGYSFDNIQIVTWRENEAKGNNDRKNGINNKKSKAVIGTCLLSGKKTGFHSMMEAERNGFFQSGISQCCSGKIKKHSGYVWSYK